MKKQNWLDHYVLDNPMTVEIDRFRKRYFSFSTGNSMNTVIVSIMLIVYSTVIMIVFANRGMIEPMPLVIVAFCVLAALAPIMLYTSVAGERERRSWDMLLVAPVSKGQIIAGKFLGACVAEIIAAVLFAIPIVIAGLYTSDKTRWPNVFAGMLFVLIITFFLNALTIFFSSRSKRALPSLGVTIGVIFVVFVALPVLVLILDGGTAAVFLGWHPLSVLSTLSSAVHPVYPDPTDSTPLAVAGPEVILLPSLFYVIFTAILLIWAEKTLIFADNEVKFIPKKRVK